MNRRIYLLVLLCLFGCAGSFVYGQNSPSSPREKVIFDTDIGDDIDDAFALGLLLSSPEVDLLGLTTAYGDTGLRARLVERYLSETGMSHIPVSVGLHTPSKTTFTQARWAERFPAPQSPWTDAISFTLGAIRKYPGQITLISVSPFTNIGALIDRDPVTFRKLKRVVIMGGSIQRGYGDLGYLPNRGPSPEYNILMDIPSARKLFASGVPVYVMPLDSTQLKLDEVKRNILFSRSKPLTDTLALLYEQWTASTQNPTPTLFDAMAVAFVLQPDLCPTRPMHIVVDDKGYTRVEPGIPNAQVCLQSDPDRFFDFYLHRILTEDLHPATSISTK
ncbi:nucleoside hydrolase [Acidipila rosea]|uniref:Inosine-uridine nucleoside N-ribohydrolase n=1 Tax=Acidipila rosea TaxID=768535 RepID=A0A4R1L072_9BACT|nr:nucleoside hydrolase [Acidipila rosea]TCK69689.1 inosine-uridine nucleoside N-ribohydrolase [Acidipila rosea]